ncbi:hypothetical protein Tco_1199055 [Tanacetum coccineum]
MWYMKNDWRSVLVFCRKNPDEGRCAGMKGNKNRKMIVIDSGEGSSNQVNRSKVKKVKKVKKRSRGGRGVRGGGSSGTAVGNNKRSDGTGKGGRTGRGGRSGGRGGRSSGRGGRGGGTGYINTCGGHLTDEQEQQLAHDEEIFREFMEEEARKEEEYARRCREEEEWEAQMDWTHPMHWTEDGNEGNREGEDIVVQDNPTQPTQQSVIHAEPTQQPTNEDVAANEDITS